MRICDNPALCLVLVSNLAISVSAHMCFATTATWGAKTQKGQLENPLNMAFGDKWPHHNAKRDTDKFITLEPGSEPEFPIVCGEAISKPEKAKELCKLKADIHQGGGCALSIAYGMKGVASPPPDKFIVFSVKHDCPSFTNFKHKFPVPSNLPACKEGDCVCGWHWVPDSKASANEMYMNTFNCVVSGSNTGTIKGGKKPNYFAVPGYPAGNTRPMYKSTFKKDGAQVLEIEGGGEAKNGASKEDKRKRWQA